MSDTTAIFSAEMARRFLSTLDPDGVFTFQTFDDDRTRKCRELARIFHGTLEQNAESLVALNERGAGVFVMVNEGDLDGRTAKNVRRIRALFVDLDGAPLEPVLQCVVPPHIIVDSSPGRYHAYWLVSDCSLEDFKALQKRLANKFSGDPAVIDLPRVMRLPGFGHRKGDPILTTVRSTISEPPYTTAQLNELLAETRSQSVNAGAIAGIVIAPDAAAPCPAGQRNSTLTSLCGAWIAEGKSTDEVKTLAQAWNSRLEEPLPDAEVLSVCSSMWRTHERNHAVQSTSPQLLAPAPTDWEAPIPFSDYTTPDIPAKYLPGEFREFAEALAIATETPQALAVFTVLGTISTAVAKRFEVSPKPGWHEPINIYTLVALPPANNKSAVLRKCTLPLREWETEQAVILEPERKRAISDKRNQEKLIDSLRAKATKAKTQKEREDLFRQVTELEGALPELKVVPQLFANDATPESLAVNVHEQGGRFAIITDEGGITETLAGLYTGGTANIDLILKGIDGGDVRVRRKDRSLDLKPFLTFLLAVQPRIIQNMGERPAFRGNGMLERFLYVVPASNLGYRTHNTPPVSSEVNQAYAAGIRRLLDIRPTLDSRQEETPRVLTLSKAAAEWFGRFHLAIEEQLRPGGILAACVGWGGKLAGYTARIAGLLHVAAHGDRVAEISETTMRHAMLIAGALIHHARAAFNLMGLDRATEDAKVVLAWITSKGEHIFRQTDCLRALHGRFTKTARLTDALQILTERNFISQPEKRATTVGKRATTFYRVNPAVLEGSR